MKQDNDDTDREVISNDHCEHSVVSTLSSGIEEDNVDNQQEVRHIDHACCDEIIAITRDPQPKKRNRADTVIGCASLPNLRYPARAMAPPLLKPQKSTINISCESDIVPAQALPHPKAGRDHSVPQPMAGGDHNVLQNQMATFKVRKWFMEEMILTMTPWGMISNEKYSMVDEGWPLAIEAQNDQQALAGASVGTPSVCQFPCGPSLKITPQSRETVSVFSVFCSWMGLVMMLIPNNIHS
jgi:hypothetical protein